MLLRQLREAERVVDRIDQKVTRLMATLQNFKDLFAGIGTETDRIAVKIQELMDKISSSGLTGPEESEILADAQAIKDRLTGIGADPTDPIPDPLPEPDPTV